MIRKAIYSTLFLCVPFLMSAQIDVKDSVIPGVILKVSYGLQFPEVDMKTRFGINSGLGGELLYKTKKNWMFGFHGQYLFGKNVNDQNEILGALGNSNNAIINQNGEGALISVEEVGYMVGVEVDKVWPWLQANANSGVITTFGIGYLEHWIKYNVEKNLVPQLEGYYTKWYDRNTSGIYLRQFLGYHFQSNSRLLNFYGGVEVTEGFTKGRRSYDQPTGGPLTNDRFDLIIGIRLGWMLPFYAKVPDEYYYY